MKKKICCLLAVFFVSVGGLFAQVSVDPNDYFYTLAQAWELKGITGPLPQLRPYPASVIARIIEDVISVGIYEDGTIVPHYEQDVQSALYQYERIFSKKWHVGVELGGAYKAEIDLNTEDFDDKKNLVFVPEVHGDIVFNKWVDFGYKVGFYAQHSDWEDILPKYTNPDHDAILDAANVGPMDIFSEFNSRIAVGTTQYYATAGLNRVGYGPFLGTGLALNDTAFHAAGVTMQVNRPKWSFASLFEAIGASNNLGEDSSGNKYLAFHAIRLHPFPWLSVSYYENVIFGRHSDFFYLLPAPFMGIQNINGSNDNIQLGLLFELRPARNLVWATDIFVDDLDVETIAKLDFDSKQRIALQTGVRYAPESSPCVLLSADYTIIMPYTYTHWEYENENSHVITGTAWNYQNYTNTGYPIGSSLPPDSDRFLFSIQFQPKSFFRLTIDTAFSRHQNVAEVDTRSEGADYILSDPNTYKTDGSIYTHSHMSGGEGSSVGKHVNTARYHLNFMTGDHSMLVCQAGLKGVVDLPHKKGSRGRFSIHFGYTFEYIKNAGIDRDIYTSVGYTTKTDSDGNITSYTYKDTPYTVSEYGTAADAYDAMYAQAERDADQALSDWRDALYDCVNHYISLSVKYTY